MDSDITLTQIFEKTKSPIKEYNLIPEISQYLPEYFIKLYGGDEKTWPLIFNRDIDELYILFYAAKYNYYMLFDIVLRSYVTDENSFYRNKKYEILVEQLKQLNDWRLTQKYLKIVLENLVTDNILSPEQLLNWPSNHGLDIEYDNYMFELMIQYYFSDLAYFDEEDYNDVLYFIFNSKIPLDTILYLAVKYNNQLLFDEARKELIYIEGDDYNKIKKLYTSAILRIADLEKQFDASYYVEQLRNDASDYLIKSFRELEKWYYKMSETLEEHNNHKSAEAFIL